MRHSTPVMSENLVCDIRRASESTMHGFKMRKHRSHHPRRQKGVPVWQSGFGNAEDQRALRLAL